MIRQCHKRAQDLFYEIKEEYPDAHVSCSFRNKMDQNLAYATRKTKKPWPQSKHNHMNKDGSPCSVAFDIFKLTERGVAEFPFNWYHEIAKWVRAEGLPLVWGGDWDNDGSITDEKFRDGPHFELAKGEF